MALCAPETRPEGRTGSGRLDRRAATSEPERPEAEGLSKKHHTESSHSHNARKQHDRQVRQYEESTSNPWHQSKNARIGMGVIAVIAVVSISLLFIGGVIRW